MDSDDAEAHCRRILEEVSGAVIADRDVLETILTGLIADGHVLLEDVPGTGKTLTARCFADALGLSFSRIQFTPDLLPSDVTGTHVFDEQSREFDFQRGPIFANVVLADEINRASPKTQAALLEAMAERQVTVDGDTYPLPDPFFVIATQNPIEMSGTFELPEAQKDRFIVKTSLGYPDPEGELELVDRRAGRRSKLPSVETVTSLDTVRRMQEAPESVHVEEDVRRYVVELVRRTRTDDRVSTGVSPRGTQRLFESARAYAVVAGRSYVRPTEVQRVARSVLPHRLVLTTDAQVDDVDGREIIEDVLAEVPVPKFTGEARP